jgi:hypothetical protein
LKEQIGSTLLKVPYGRLNKCSGSHSHRTMAKRHEFDQACA